VDESRFIGRHSPLEFVPERARLPGGSVIGVRPSLFESLGSPLDPAPKSMVGRLNLSDRRLLGAKDWFSFVGQVQMNLHGDTPPTARCGGFSETLLQMARPAVLRSPGGGSSRNRNDSARALR
jgi:hypothetical protein